MRILAISDWIDPILYEHFDRERWREVDVVVSCGDLPPHYLDFLSTTLCRPVLYVRGNHDERYSRCDYAGLFDLNRCVWRHSGVTVVGFEGSMCYNTTGVQYTETQMRRRVWRTTHKLREIDVVVAHAPAAGCNDRMDLCHRGFECFRPLLRRFRPKLLIHGHTHIHGSAQRMSILGDTRVVNAFGHYLLDV